MIKKITGYAIILISGLIAQVSLLMLGLFLFYGSFELIHLGTGTAASLFFDALLSAVFFAQHSGMMRNRFRRWLERSLDKEFHGAVFTIASGMVLLMVLIFWQKTPGILFPVHGTMRWLLRGLYFLTIAGFAWGASSLQPFDPMGLTPIVNRLRTKAPAPGQLSIRGPYRYVRHPLYLFTIVMIWSCPDITVDRLVFNILWTLWVIIGARFEERDLVATFGDAYRDYQQKIPMLVPRSIRPVL